MNRRHFIGAVGATALTTPQLLAQAANAQQPSDGFITDVEGIRVGHFTDTRRPTGCTVILYERGAVAGVDVRGSAPGTRETDLLKPINLVDRVNAIVLSGGSAFGLDSATGVMRYLEEHDAGFATAAGKVPIVPAAILYDLGVGDPKIRPTAESGYQACKNAAAGRVAEGNVGAGAGATVGKLSGGHPMKGGIGTASIKLTEGLVVAAIVAVNCTGDVIDPRSGKIVAGARTADGKGFLGITQTLTIRPRRDADRRTRRRGREHDDRRRGDERAFRQNANDESGGDGARRPRARNQPGAHAVRRRHAVRAVDRHVDRLGEPHRDRRACGRGRDRRHSARGAESEVDPRLSRRQRPLAD